MRAYLRSNVSERDALANYCAILGRLEAVFGLRAAASLQVKHMGRYADRQFELLAQAEASLMPFMSHFVINFEVSRRYRSSRDNHLLPDIHDCLTLLAEKLDAKDNQAAREMGVFKPSIGAAVAAYLHDHPDASLEELSKGTGISAGAISQTEIWKMLWIKRSYAP